MRTVIYKEHGSDRASPMAADRVKNTRRYHRVSYTFKDLFTNDYSKLNLKTFLHPWSFHWKTLISEMRLAFTQFSFRECSFSLKWFVISFNLYYVMRRDVNCLIQEKSELHARCWPCTNGYINTVISRRAAFEGNAARGKNWHLWIWQMILL